MKFHYGRLSRALVLILVGAILCSAQQPAASVGSLKDQIAKLEAIDRDPSTTEEVKTLNRKFLNERRLQLRAALGQRLETLRKYQVTVKPLLSATENKVLAESIADVEKELEGLKDQITTQENGTTSVDAAATSTSTNGTASVGANNGTTHPQTAIAATVTAPAIQPPPQQVPAVTVATCNGATNSYQDAPPLLKDSIERVADDIISGAQSATNAISFKFDDMFLYAVAHAVAPAADTSVSSIKSLKAYQYLGETVRTDKQIGAPAKGSGTTSLIEKPSFARLLGFAVENGAITQDVSTTNLTLSTSPYLFYTFGNGGDTAENYQRAGVLNRIGLSASFNLKDQNNVLANATRNQLSEWSVRARLLGDRSTRSKAFQEFWFKPGGPRDAIEARLKAVTNALPKVSPGFAPEFNAFTNVETDLDAVVTAVAGSPSYAAADAAKKKQLLTNASLCVMRSEVYNPITSNAFPIAQAKKDQINLQLIPAIAAAMGNIEAVRKLLSEKMDEFQKGPLATFAYINHRRPVGSDYSEFKFLYQHEGAALQPMKLVANFGASIYNKPSPTLNQQRLRNIAFDLSFEGKFNSPFLKDTADLSKVTYAFTGSYQRTFENRNVAGRKADIAAFQFKLDVPVFAGFSVPLAVTYANATEQQRKSHVRFNFGSGFDFDKLLAVMKLLRQ